MNTMVKITTTNGEAKLMSLLGGSVVFNPKSTAVTEIVYVGSNKHLTVTYTNGGKYYYYGVEFPTVIELLGADSVGSFIAKQIKPNYECIKDTTN